MLTRSGWATVASGIAALAVGRTLALLELYVLGATALAAALGALLWVWFPSPAIEVHRRLRPQHPTAGGAARVELVVRNAGPRRTSTLIAHDAVAGTVGARLPLAPQAGGADQVVGYQLPTRRRGSLAIGPLEVRRVDPLGLAGRRVAEAAEAAVSVLPRPASATGAELGHGHRHPGTERTDAMAMTSAVAELDILRPYQIGDDLRRVHWRASAHADDLLVRRDEEPRRGLLVVVLDARARAMAPEQFELAVSSAAGLVEAAASAGHRVRLAVTDGTDTGGVDARRSRLALLQLLALVDQHDDVGVSIARTDPRTTDRVVALSGDRATAAELPGADGTDVVVVVHALGSAPTIEARVGSGAS